MDLCLFDTNLLEWRVCYKSYNILVSLLIRKIRNHRYVIGNFVRYNIQ